MFSVKHHLFLNISILQTVLISFCCFFIKNSYNPTQSSFHFMLCRECTLSLFSSSFDFPILRTTHFSSKPVLLSFSSIHVHDFFCNSLCRQTIPQTIRHFNLCFFSLFTLLVHYPTFLFFYFSFSPLFGRHLCSCLCRRAGRIVITCNSRLVRISSYSPSQIACKLCPTLA